MITDNILSEIMAEMLAGPWRAMSADCIKQIYESVVRDSRSNCIVIVVSEVSIGDAGPFVVQRQFSLVPRPVKEVILVASQDPFWYCDGYDSHLTVTVQRNTETGT